LAGPISPSATWRPATVCSWMWRSPRFPRASTARRPMWRAPPSPCPPWSPPPTSAPASTPTAACTSGATCPIISGIGTAATGTTTTAMARVMTGPIRPTCPASSPWRPATVTSLP